MFEKLWWTWTGSNRRPLPCHLRNINHLRTLSLETKDLTRGDLDASGRPGATFGRLDSTVLPASVCGEDRRAGRAREPGNHAPILRAIAGRMLQHAVKNDQR